MEILGKLMPPLDKKTLDTELETAFQGEFDFWDRELSLRGDFAESMRNRLMPLERGDDFPQYIAPLLDSLRQRFKEAIRVLDVGSGPVSMLSLGHARGDFDLVAADPLGQKYTEALEKYGHSVPYPIVATFGEELSNRFGADAFHLVWMHNALDHSQSPRTVVRELIQVLKPGGYLIILGWSREGTAQDWGGLHQHDLYLEPNGRLMCQSEDGHTECILEARHSLSWRPASQGGLTEGLPIELVETSSHTSEVKQWMKLVCRKTGPASS